MKSRKYLLLRNFRGLHPFGVMRVLAQNLQKYRALLRHFTPLYLRHFLRELLILQARIYGGGGLGGLTPPLGRPPQKKKKKKKRKKKKKKRKKKRKKKERTLERNPFKCKYCEKIFNSSGNLTKHMITLDIIVYLTVT